MINVKAYAKTHSHKMTGAIFIGENVVVNIGKAGNDNKAG